MNITASPIPLVVGEKEFQLSPLSDQASHALTQWVRADLMASAWMAEGTLRKDPKCTDSEEFRKSIMQAALGVEWTDEGGTAILKSPVGLSRLLVESLRPTTPGVTQRMAMAILAVEGVPDAFWDLFLMVNDLQELDGEVSKKKADTVQSDAGGNLSESVGAKGDSSD